MMNMIVEYVLCYGLAFGIGFFVGGLVTLHMMLTYDRTDS